MRWEPLLLAMLVMAVSSLASRFSPRLPAPLVGVLFACSISVVTGLHTRQVGRIALEIPEFVSFSWTPRDVISVLPSAVGLAFVAATNLLVTSRLAGWCITFWAITSVRSAPITTANWAPTASPMC
jgi:MFS superfamily sulfate permease-like transporter